MILKILLILEYLPRLTILLLVFSTSYSRVSQFSGIISMLTIFSFLFLNLFIGNEIMVFISIIILGAADFWTVKNVTGRMLVNLRWWSEIDEHGHEEWVFESNDEAKTVGATDSFVFWSSLYITPLIWGFFAFMDLLSFKFFWMYVCILCLALSAINTMAYYQC